MTNEELEKKLKSTNELDKFKDKPSGTGTGEAKELKIKRTIKLQEAHVDKYGIWLEGKSSWYFSTGDKAHSERHHWTFAVCEINNIEYVLSWYWYPPVNADRKKWEPDAFSTLIGNSYWITDKRLIENITKKDNLFSNWNEKYASNHACQIGETSDDFVNVLKPKQKEATAIDLTKPSSRENPSSEWIKITQDHVNSFEAGRGSGLSNTENDCVKWEVKGEHYVVKGLSPFSDVQFGGTVWIDKTYYVHEKLLDKIKTKSPPRKEKRLYSGKIYYCWGDPYPLTKQEINNWIKSIKEETTASRISDDGEEVDDEPPKPGQNPSKTLLINYKVVNIYKLSDMRKLGKKLFRTKTSTGATIGGGIGALVGSLFAICAAPVTGGASLFALAPLALKGAAVGAGVGALGGAGIGWVTGEVTGEHDNLSQRGGIAFGVESGKGLTDKAYRAEYTIIKGEGNASELCGNSIVPYIVKGAKEWEDETTKKYGIKSEEEFILNPNPKSVSSTIARHYKEKHCYFNFKVYGDDHSQYYGITPINNDPTKYGIKWSVDLTHYVSSRMIITIGDEFDLLTYDSLIKEDYDNSGGLARWVAQSMIMLGTAYIGGKLLSQSAISAASAAGDAGIKKAEATNAERLATGKYKDGNPYRFGKFEQARLDAAETAKEDKISLAQTMTAGRSGSQMVRAAGRSFAGATRLFGGGKGSYTSGINEFIHNKAHFPPLRIEARTSKSYLERWTREMNKNIADWHFYFGDDPELTEKKDFGKVQGTGSQVFANAHGKYRLSEETIFPQASPNPLIDLWTKTSIFVYTECCGKQPHESICERPRLTEDDFFSGFKAELTETISREGRKEVVEWTTTEEHATTTDNDITGTFGFVFAWCGSKDDPTNKISLGSNMGSAGALRITAFNGDADKEKGNGKIGDSDCFVSSSSNSKDITPFRGRQYHEIYWGRIHPSACGELEFGKGEGYDYLVTRYEKGHKKEECIWTKNPEETWVLRYNPAHYSAAGGLTFSTRSTTTETKTHRIERNFNPLNISSTISLTGFSGLEGWGGNPPDSFGGGGGMDVSVPLSAASMKEELGGMSVSLPQGLGQNVAMPESIQSMLNTEDINVNIKMPEMPQAEAISQAQQQQEQIQQFLNIGTSEQNLNTERGEASGEKTGQKEKVSEK